MSQAIYATEQGDHVEFKTMAAQPLRSMIDQLGPPPTVVGNVDFAKVEAAIERVRAGTVACMFQPCYEYTGDIIHAHQRAIGPVPVHEQDKGGL